ncbi:MAG: hypothetical protein HUK03_00040 [Bacteroidaceae bacterium]|nr:hypothetical protein [Bacteroidaceae bacterium]
MKKRLLNILLAAFATVTLHAQVNLDVRIDSINLLVGEQTGITLEVTYDAQRKLTLPDLRAGSELIPNVEVVNVSSPDTAVLNDGKRLSIKQKYTITAWDSALYTLPPLEVMVDTQRYQSKCLALKVISFEVDTLHTDKFYPPHPHMELPFAWSDWRLLVCLSFVVVVLLVLVLVLLDRASKGKPIVRIIRRKKTLPPHKVAIDEIERIKADRKWAEEDSKEYYTLLTDTLRNYIQERYGFSAMEMTSGEIIQHLLEVSDEASLAELKEIFRTADLVKFAKWNTLINENDANLVAAIEYINQTKQEVDPNAKPEPEIIKETDKERLTQVRLMRAISVLLGLSALALLGWIVWRAVDILM